MGNVTNISNKKHVGILSVRKTHISELFLIKAFGYPTLVEWKMENSMIYDPTHCRCIRRPKNKRY